jgi:hypothetical protein
MAQGTIVKAYRGPVGTLPTLEAGQLGFTTDTNDLYIGDGVTNHKIGGLPTTGGTMSGAINMGNQDISYLKLLKLNGEIDDGNSGAADIIDWNAGVAHKSTLTENATFAFTGYGANQIPYMTTNTAPSGVASSNIAVPTNSFYFFRSGAQGSVQLPANCWAKYAFPAGTTKIPVAFTVRFYSGWCPASLKLEASNDDSSWTQLINATITNDALTQFTFSNMTAYRYFRWTTPTNTFPSELSVQEGTVNPDAPCFLTLKLVQDATGGRTVTWPATVKGSPVINQAANAVSNVLLYWDGTYYWVLNGKQFASATDKLIGRSTAGAGELEEIACTAAGRALLDDADAAAQLATLGAAAAATAPVISTGTAAPTSTPAKVGNIYIDTTGAKAYIAKGTSSSADWMLLN